MKTKILANFQICISVPLSDSIKLLPPENRLKKHPEDSAFAAVHDSSRIKLLTSVLISVI